MGDIQRFNVYRSLSLGAGMFSPVAVRRSRSTGIRLQRGGRVPQAWVSKAADR